MREAYPHDKPINTIHVISVGAFGEAIALILKEFFPGLQETRSEAQSQLTAVTCPQAQFHIIAAWRMTSGLCHLLEDICYQQKTSFISAMLNGTLLQIGPVVVPGMGACYTCYEKRFFQHSPLQSLQCEIYKYYDMHPEQGPQGYLPAFADIAVAKIVHIMNTLDTDPIQVAGQIWQWNTMTLEGINSSITGIHACPRCGLQRDETKRSYEEMRQTLSHSLSWDAPTLSAQNLVSSEHNSTGSPLTVEERRSYR